MSRSSLHDAARELAYQKVPVFPCIPGQKKPATPHGFKNATTDPDIIDGWWAADDYNVALSPGDAGWAVLDVDPDKGGMTSLEALEIAHGPIRDTLTVKTPSGGLHLYFEGTLPRNTASKLGPGLDTRSIGGYVLVPPSMVDGVAYEAVNSLPMAPLPQWLAEAVVAQRNVNEAGEVGLDLPWNVARFREHARGLEPATAGSVNEAGTSLVGVACDMALSREAAWPIIVAEWGARCSPPFGDDDKLYDCGLWTQRQNTGHPLALPQEPVAAEVFKQALALPGIVEPTETSSYPPSLSARDLASGDFPRPAWLIEHLILEAHVNLLVGDGKVGKTFAVLHMAVAVAAGLELWGLECRQAPVLIVLAEDDVGETKARLEGICAALGVALEALPIDLWCLPGNDLTLAHVSDNGGVREGPFLRPLVDKIVETGARFVILDPLSDFADLDETKRLAANAYCKRVLGPIAHKMGVTVAQTGHPSKTSMSDGSVVSGSTAWKNAVRNVLSMERLKDEPKSPKRTLRAAWSNYGDERELDLHLAGGVLYSAASGPGPTDAEMAASRDALIHAVAVVAIKAAETGKPINGNTKRLATVQLDEIRSQIGRIPSNDEVKEALAAAVWRKLLSFLPGTARRRAGYYPPDELGIELAIKAKRAARADAVKLGFLPPDEGPEARHA